MAKQKRYIGSYEILSETHVSDEETQVTFAPYTTEDGRTFQPPVRVYTKKKLFHATTNEPTDLNTLQQNVYTPIIDEMVRILVEYDIHVGFKGHVQNDLEFVLSRVEQKIVNWRNTYEDRLWGAEEYEKTLRQIVKGLDQIDGSDMIELKEVKDRPKDSE